MTSRDMTSKTAGHAHGRGIRASATPTAKAIPTVTGIAHNISLASKRATAIYASRLAGSAITLPQLSVLEAVAIGGEPSQTLLVERTGIDRSTLADIVLRLIGSNHLARKRSRDDRRAYVVSLTDKGERALAVGRAAARETEGLLLREWPALAAFRDSRPRTWNVAQPAAAE